MVKLLVLITKEVVNQKALIREVVVNGKTIVDMSETGESSGSSSKKSHGGNTTCEIGCLA